MKKITSLFVFGSTLLVGFSLLTKKPALLHAPHRAAYTLKRKDSVVTPSTTCFFCNASTTGQRVLKKFKHCFAVLNDYPYSDGHVMIVPLEHKSALEEITAAARAEMMEVATQCTVSMKKIPGVDGFNIGFNIGQAAGASVAGHLHLHLVPRRNSDTGFMQTLAHTSIVSLTPDQVYGHLKPIFDAMTLPEA